MESHLFGVIGKRAIRQCKVAKCARPFLCMLVLWPAPTLRRCSRDEHPKVAQPPTQGPMEAAGKGV